MTIFSTQVKWQRLHFKKFFSPSFLDDEILFLYTKRQTFCSRVVGSCNFWLLSLGILKFQWINTSDSPFDPCNTFPWNLLFLDNWQLMNEAEYLMKNYGDWGGCYKASTDNTLKDLHNSSYDTKAEFSNFFIIHSK